MAELPWLAAGTYVLLLFFRSQVTSAVFSGRRGRFSRSLSRRVEGERMGGARKIPIRWWMSRAAAVRNENHIRCLMPIGRELA
jgi:hypothetical protein